MGPNQPATEEPKSVAASAAGSTVPQDAPIVSAGPILDAPFNGALQPVDPKSIDQGSLLDEMPMGLQEEESPFSKRRLSRQRALGTGLLVFGILAAVFLGIRIEANKSKAQEASLASPSARFQQQQVPLGTLNKQLGTASTAGSAVTVNGQLQVTNSLVLQPSAQTGPAVTGQMYYDSTTNALAYYNGKQYVSLQGGGNVTNNTTNVTNITNNTSITNSGGGFAGTGTPGTLAMFASATTLGNSLITESNATTLNVANTGTTTTNVGSGAGTSATNMQGGTGGISILTGAANGASGAIAIQSGDSSTTSSGNVSIDTGLNAVVGTVVLDHTFENSTENIGDAYGFLDTYAQSSAQAHSGTYSLAVTSGNGQYGGGTEPSWYAADNAPYTTPGVAGDNYLFSAWVRAATTGRTIDCDVYWSSDGYGGGGQIEDDQWCSVTDSTSAWKHISGTLTAPPGTHEIGVAFTGYDSPAGEVHYIDDVTVTDVSSTPTVSQLNLGTNNAQQVTIGNSSASAATTIYGHGLTLDGGQSAVNVSGGSFNLTSRGTITLTGGTFPGSGVVVNAQAPTTTELQVQGDDVDLLTVDSVNNAVSLGTGAGTSFGNIEIGPYTNGGAGGPFAMSATKFTTDAGGTIASMSAYISAAAGDPYNQFQFAIYSDNSGAPGDYIASSPVGTLSPTAGWNSLPLTATLSPSTTYWLVYWQDDPDNDSGNGDAYFTGVSGAVTYQANNVDWQSGPDDGMPDTFPTGGAGVFTGNLRSIYASFDSDSPALTVNRYGTLTQDGAATFQDSTDSTQAFQVQNSSGVSLLTVDTADTQIDINGNLAITGHIITGGSTPTIAAGAAACAAPTVSVAGNDTSGTVTVTTGTGCSTGGTLATVTFAASYGDPPNVTLTPANAAASTLQYYNGTTTDGTFTVDTNNTPGGSTAYEWHYWAAQ